MAVPCDKNSGFETIFIFLFVLFFINFSISLLVPIGTVDFITIIISFANTLLFIISLIDSYTLLVSAVPSLFSGVPTHINITFTSSFKFS